MVNPETSTWQAMENKDVVKVKNPKIISDIQCTLALHGEICNNIFMISACCISLIIECNGYQVVVVLFMYSCELTLQC